MYRTRCVYLASDVWLDVAIAIGCVVLCCSGAALGLWLAHIVYALFLVALYLVTCVVLWPVMSWCPGQSGLGPVGHVGEERGHRQRRPRVGYTVPDAVLPCLLLSFPPTGKDDPERDTRTTAAGGSMLVARGDCCVICLDDIDIWGTAKLGTLVACTHTFHHACVAEWLQRSVYCPLCRRDVRVVNVNVTPPQLKQPTLC